MSVHASRCSAVMLDDVWRFSWRSWFDWRISELIGLSVDRVEVVITTWAVAFAITLLALCNMAYAMILAAQGFSGSLAPIRVRCNSFLPPCAASAS